MCEYAGEMVSKEEVERRKWVRITVVTLINIPCSGKKRADLDNIITYLQ